MTQSRRVRAGVPLPAEVSESSPRRRRDPRHGLGALPTPAGLDPAATVLCRRQMAVVQRLAGNQAAVAWLRDIRARAGDRGDAARPLDASDAGAAVGGAGPGPVVQRVVAPTRRGDKIAYYSTWQKELVSLEVAPRIDLFDDPEAAAAADREWEVVWRERAAATGRPTGGSKGEGRPTGGSQAECRPTGRSQGEGPPARGIGPAPKRAHPQPPRQEEARPQAASQSRSSLPIRPPPRPPRPPRSQAPTPVGPAAVPARGAPAPRTPTAAPARSSRSWSDLSPQAQRDLDDAWREHRRKPFESADDLNQRWYKASSVKKAPHGGGYPPTGALGVRTRIYLNTTVEGTRHVYEWCLRHVKPLDGVAAVKSGDQELAAWARDVIVVYVSDPSVEPTVMSLLGGYDHPEHFVPELVRFTRAVQGLPGVGIGDDPPDIDELREPYHADKDPDWKDRHEVSTMGRPSFSQYRSHLVFRALAAAEGDRERFRSLVVAYFEQGGIDPRTPSRQGQASPSVLEALGLVRTKRVIEASVSSVEGDREGKWVFAAGFEWEVVEALGPGGTWGPSQRPLYWYLARRFE